MSTKKNPAPKAKKATASKEELKQRMEEKTFEKKFETLRKALVSDKYADQYFPNESVVTVPGPLFQAILDERKKFTDFLGSLSEALGNTPKKIEGLFATTTGLTFEMMTLYKELVDTGVTNQVERPLGAAPTSGPDAEKLAALQNRYGRRTQQLGELGFKYENKKFILGKTTLEPQQVFDAEEVDFLALMLGKNPTEETDVENKAEMKIVE